MKRYTYAVFAGSKWGRTNNKRQAIAYAKQHGGCVMAMPYSFNHEPIDAPSFWGQARIIADFRGEDCSPEALGFTRTA